MLFQHILGAIHKHTLISEKDTVIVAVSGGIDSTALLHILHALPLQLHLIAHYVDHSLRPNEAPEEIDFLNNLTKKLNISFIISKVDVPALRKIQHCSLEEAARILRYKELYKSYTLYAAQKIAVAHTLDDQIEGLYLKLVRGSGLKGLAGMAYRSGNIIRPLIDVRKEQLTEYLRSHDITACYDSSNSDSRLLRNRIRMELIPFLTSRFNPSLHRTHQYMMQILTEDENFLSDTCNSTYDKIVQHVSEFSQNSEPVLNLKTDDFLFLPPALQRRTIEKLLRTLDSPVSFHIIEDVRSIIATHSANKHYHLSHGLRMITLDRYIQFSYPRGRQSIRGTLDHPHAKARNICGSGKYAIEELGMMLHLAVTCKADVIQFEDNCLYCDAELIPFPITLRAVAPGDRMRCLGMSGHKSVNKILSDLKIPASMRYRFPVLAAQDSIIALLGKRIAEPFKITDDTQNVMSIRWSPLDAES